MNKSKKLLSVFLAVVMVLSTFTVGFYAVAADEGETADSAVTDVQTKIAAFYDNRTYLFSTSNAERHEQAVKDYDAAVAALKALSETQKLELSAPYYGFILYYVTQSVAREVLPDEIITEAKSLYAQLSADSKGSVPEETYNKFVQIVTPIKDTNDFSDEIAAFRPTAFVRPTNSKTAWTEGGIQSFVDKLGSFIGGFVDLDAILSDNLYQASVINAIFDLYATLSHNTTDIEGLITLGEIISGVITPEYLTSSLPEGKFSAVVEKINAAEVAEDDPEGTNILDKIAAIDFTAEDWGFTSGDKDGFVDALLAALRPITQLLDPEAQISFKALGILTVTANIGLRMFDPQITDDGNYAAGIYENLLPLLEQLGMNDLPTTEEYRANYYQVKEESGAAIAADEFLKPILDSLFANVVDPITADPLNGLVKILPRLAYVVDGYGMLLDNSLIGGKPTGNEIWRIEAAAGQGGTICPSGTVELKQPDSKTFTITANEGYTINSLTVNGTAVSAAAGKTSYDYTVSGADVTSSDSENYYPTDVTISVTFADESGNPAPGPDPDEPGTNPGGGQDPSGGNGTGTDTNTGNTNLPAINGNNPNLPNTGAQAVAGMSVITVILAIAAGAIVWLVLRKRIAE